MQGTAIHVGVKLATHLYWHRCHEARQGVVSAQDTAKVGGGDCIPMRGGPGSMQNGDRLKGLTNSVLQQYAPFRSSLISRARHTAREQLLSAPRLFA